MNQHINCKHSTVVPQEPHDRGNVYFSVYGVEAGEVKVVTVSS